jgi:hypothetical protein
MDQKAVNSLLERPAPNETLTLRAYRIIERWLEWARMHGQLEHAEGIVKDSRELIAEDDMNTETLEALRFEHRGSPDYLLEAYKRGCRDERAAAKVRNDDEVQRLMGILRRQEICPACGETTFDGDCTCPNEKAEG